MRTIAAPSEVRPNRRPYRCYVCKRKLNPTKPSTIGFMRSDEWPYEDYVLAHLECGETAGLRPVRLSRSEPLPVTLEATEEALTVLQRDPFTVEYYGTPETFVNALLRGEEPDLPHYVFSIGCSFRDGEPVAETASYDRALQLLQNADESGCSGEHKLDVRRA